MNEKHGQKGSITRRSFLNRLWAFLGIITVAEVAVLATRFFKPRKPVVDATAADAVITAGPVDNFEPGTVSAFVRGKFYLARLEDGGFLAMSRSCTHLSCTVPWVAKENRFICPCHSSEFAITGEVINPPAPRALDLYKVTIENDVLKVDTSQLERRSSFEASQVVYVKDA
ncbi:MAG: Rieske 2Fe-2S domain-containing protein [Xanthomonadales bacterium]|nr:Rieske 2Fe-2S domain-containing protein [Xanthomonadales bacterium]